MSIVVAEKLVKRILKDASFKEQIMVLADSEKLALLKKEGYEDVTEAEVWAVGRKLALANSSGELTDDELQQIVGGVNITTFSSAVGIAAAISAILD